MVAYIPPTVKRYAKWTGESQITLLAIWDASAKEVGEDVTGYYRRYAATTRIFSEKVSNAGIRIKKDKLYATNSTPPNEP